MDDGKEGGGEGRGEGGIYIERGLWSLGIRGVFLV